MIGPFASVGAITFRSSRMVSLVEAVGSWREEGECKESAQAGVALVLRRGVGLVIT
jgi:hypothetical protein